jgi:UDP-N-acetylmuramate--alanine ligase
VRLPADGFLVFNKDNNFIPKITKPKFKTIGYSLKQPISKKIKSIIKVPGKHNISNALAVMSVAKILEVKESVALKSISKFKGTWRRFEIKQGMSNGKTIILVSDNGHHPSEISATLSAAREKYAKKKIWCVFQPHQHQRTYYLFKDFVKTFRQVSIDKIIITDIYDVAGRETKSKSRGVSSEKLVKAINKENIIYLPIKEIEKFVSENINSGDVLIIMGAGDIYKLAGNF